MTDEILIRDFRIDELNKKKEVFSNYVSKLKKIIKNGRRFRNLVEFSLEDKTYSLLQTYHFKRKA